MTHTCKHEHKCPHGHGTKYNPGARCQLVPTYAIDLQKIHYTISDKDSYDTSIPSQILTFYEHKTFPARSKSQAKH